MALALAAAAPAGLASAQDRPLRETTTEQMPPGMATAYVRALQSELNARGYPAGPVDGVAGPRTREAIRMYQRDVGLPATGRPSKELLEHIKFADPVAAGSFARPVQSERAPPAAGMPEPLIPPSEAGPMEMERELPGPYGR